MTDATMLQYWKDDRTPASSINVIANQSFGFHVSTEGSGFTWSINSQPISSPPGRRSRLRSAQRSDLYTRRRYQRIWGPTALPIRENDRVLLGALGHGYGRFNHASHGISLELLPMRAS